MKIFVFAFPILAPRYSLAVTANLSFLVHIAMLERMDCDVLAEDELREVAPYNTEPAPRKVPNIQANY